MLRKRQGRLLLILISSIYLVTFGLNSKNKLLSYPLKATLPSYISQTLGRTLRLNVLTYGNLLELMERDKLKFLRINKLNSFKKI